MREACGEATSGLPGPRVRWVGRGWTPIGWKTGGSSRARCRGFLLAPRGPRGIERKLDGALRPGGEEVPGIGELQPHPDGAAGGIQHRIDDGHRGRVDAADRILPRHLPRHPHLDLAVEVHRNGPLHPEGSTWAREMTGFCWMSTYSPGEKYLLVTTPSSGLKMVRSLSRSSASLISSFS